MNEKQFLTELKEALRGRVSDDAAAYNVNYYREYIESQKEAGKTDAEIFSGLGTPQMIAKSIISAENGTKGTENSGPAFRSKIDWKHLGWNPFSWNSFESGPVWQKVLTVAVWLLILFFVYPSAARVVKYLFWPVVIVCACVICCEYVKTFRARQK